MISLLSYCVLLLFLNCSDGNKSDSNSKVTKEIIKKRQFDNDHNVSKYHSNNHPCLSINEKDPTQSNLREATYSKSMQINGYTTNDAFSSIMNSAYGLLYFFI